MKDTTQLPRVVAYLMNTYGAVLVGSAARWFVGEQEHDPNDYDLLMTEIGQIQPAVSYLNNHAEEVRINRFGGLKVKIVGGNMIDIWPDSLQGYTRYIPRGTHFAVMGNPTRIVRVEK